MLQLDPAYPNKAAMWYAIVKECMGSPRSNRAWCIEANICYNQFRSWKRKFAMEQNLPECAKWKVQCPTQPDPDCPPAYARLREKRNGASIYLVLSPIRRNLSVDSMVCQVQLGLGLNPRNGDGFLFVSTCKTQIFLLTFHRDGFLVLCKKREEGKFYWPRQIEPDGSTDLKVSQGKWLTDLLCGEEKTDEDISSNH